MSCYIFLMAFPACKSRDLDKNRLTADDLDDSLKLHADYVASCGSAPTISGFQLANEIDPQAIKKILADRCAKCHYKGSDSGTSAFDDILDVKELVSKKIIIPGNGDGSVLYKRVATGFMPLGGTKLPAEQIGLIKDWIDGGATDFKQSTASAVTVQNGPSFISTADTFACIQRDVSNLTSFVRPFTRYITMTHLYNGGHQDQLNVNRQAVNKLTNSLSWKQKISLPFPVDSVQTIYRIDLRDYGWNDQIWKQIIATNPYNADYIDPAFAAIKQATNDAQPIIRGDWFVNATSKPPLYHDILGIPGPNNAEGGLEKLLGINTARDINEGTALRTGFKISQVSNNNRVIERHVTGYGYYWQSYDFDSNVGEKNIFKNPLDLLQNRAGGEIIFSLPNGLQGYMLTNAKGTRLDEGPIAIVQHKKRKRGGFTVLNAVSCMDCHSKGIIPKEDEIRAAVINNPAYSADEKAAVDLLYKNDQSLFDADATAFKVAVESTGVDINDDDPVFKVADHFEDPVDEIQAAAELGLSLNEFRKRLSNLGDLSRQLAFNTTATVDRQLFLSLYADLVRGLEIGASPLPPKNIDAIPVNKPGAPAVRPSTQSVTRQFSCDPLDVNNPAVDNVLNVQYSFPNQPSNRSNIFAFKTKKVCEDTRQRIRSNCENFGPCSVNVCIPENEANPTLTASQFNVSSEADGVMKTKIIAVFPKAIDCENRIFEELLRSIKK